MAGTFAEAGDDDVTESLDALLAAKIADDEDDDEDTLADLDDGTLDGTLEVRVVPVQADEFTCSRCFLVRHRSQLAERDRTVCRDCA